MLDWIGRVFEFLSILLQKIPITPEEKSKTRKEKAKEAWDKLVEEEKRIQADLYKPAPCKHD